MCGKNELFMDLDAKVNIVAKFGDDQKIVVKEKEKILIHACNEDRIIISNVFYVPELESKLLSVGQLQIGDICTF